MKKLFTLLLCLTLCAALFTAGAPAFAEEAERETFTSGGFEYTLLDDGTAKIIKYEGKGKTLAIPDTLEGHAVTSIGDEAFHDCSSLTSITIPDSVSSIGANPFKECEKLTLIKISPDHPALAIIDGVLFSKADKRLVCCPYAFNASSYSVPQGIKVIDDEAFYGCNSLMSVTIPDSVSSIGANPFKKCEKLTLIKISPDHPALAIIDGVLFSKADKRLVCYPYAFNASSYSVPQGIKVIGDEAFYGCNSLMSVTIPESVTSIGDGAFYYCRSLVSVNIPESVSSIGDRAFHDCGSLASITIPDSVTFIGNAAFAYCLSLTSITIPDSVTSIGDKAFSGCIRLTVTVGRDSYAKEYCIKNDLNYTYADANDWLNN